MQQREKSGMPLSDAMLQDECHYGDDTVARSQIRRSINGYMYDNVPGMEMRIGERVRWYLAGIQLSEKAS